MLTEKQVKDLTEKGWNEKTIFEVDSFLNEGGFSYHNLADIGGNDFRLMYKDKNNKIQCRLSRIPN